jgi:hypothetical protein
MIRGPKWSAWVARLFPVTGQLSSNVTEHNRWPIRCHRTEQHNGRARFHVPVTRECANDPIGACSHYRQCQAVPVWPVQYSGWIWLVTCPLWTTNGSDATSSKNPLGTGYDLKLAQFYLSGIFFNEKKKLVSVPLVDCVPHNPCPWPLV